MLCLTVKALSEYQGFGNLNLAMGALFEAASYFATASATSKILLISKVVKSDVSPSP